MTIKTKNRIETFTALDPLPVIHGFTLREPGLDVRLDREAALERLAAIHAAERDALGLDDRVFATANQVHGKQVAIVDAATFREPPEADGLITRDHGICLGVTVADCCPVYLFDPEKRVIGLLHSGRKGSELGIVREAIERMQLEFQKPAGVDCRPTRAMHSAAEL